MGEMTRWNEICRLSPSFQRPIVNLYEESNVTFPLVLRHYCAPFLESKFNSQNQINEAFSALSLFKSQLIEQIYIEARRLENFEMGQIISSNAQHCYNLFSTAHDLENLSSEEVFKTIQGTLEMEKEIHTNVQGFSALLFKIRSKVVKLLSVPLALSDSEWETRDEYRSFHLSLKNLKEQKLPGLESAVEKLIEQQQYELDLEGAFQNLRVTLKSMVDELDEISYDWKLSCIFPRPERASEVYFDFIQNCMTEILDVARLLTEFVRGTGFSTFYSHLTPHFSLPELDEHIEKLHRNSLRVKTQPSKIMSKDQKQFSASIYTFCSSPENVKSIFISIITEDKKRILATTKQPNFPPNLKINNSDVGFEKKEPKKKRGKKLAKKYCQSPGSTSADIHDPVVQFKNGKISLKRHKGGKKVMEGKYYALFHTEVKMPNGAFEKVWCISSPFVFSVHGSQNCEGYRTIFWSTYAHSPLASLKSDPPSKVECQKLGQALKYIFHDITESSRELNPDEIDYLLKLVCAPQEGAVFPAEIPASWLFEPKNGSPFSFWTWFYSIMCILRKDRKLRSYWDSWSILGFIERDSFSCTSPLIHFLTFSSSEDIGAFFLRFSETELGKISVSYVKKYRIDGIPEIASCEPFALCHEREKEDKTKSLAWCIHNLTVSAGPSSSLSSSGFPSPASSSGYDFGKGSVASPGGQGKCLTNVIQRKWNSEKDRSEWGLVSKEANEAFGSKNNVLQEGESQKGKGGNFLKKPYEMFTWILRINKKDDEELIENSPPMEF